LISQQLPLKAGEREKGKRRTERGEGKKETTESTGDAENV
jgi:hypothetical protein